MIVDFIENGKVWTRNYKSDSISECAHSLPDPEIQINGRALWIAMKFWEARMVRNRHWGLLAFLLLASISSAVPANARAVPTEEATAGTIVSDRNAGTVVSDNTGAGTEVRRSSDSIRDNLVSTGSLVVRGIEYTCGYGRVPIPTGGLGGISNSDFSVVDPPVVCIEEAKARRWVRNLQNDATPETIALAVPGVTSILVSLAILMFSIYLYRLIKVEEGSITTERDGILIYAVCGIGAPVVTLIGVAKLSGVSETLLSTGILFYIAIVELAFALGMSLLAVMRISVEVSKHSGEVGKAGTLGLPIAASILSILASCAAIYVNAQRIADMTSSA